MAKKRKQTGRKANTLGASYRAASSGLILATPAIGVVKTARSPEAFVNAYRSEAKPFILGTLVHAADQMIGQRFVGHNAALGRGSVTAWVGEAVPTAL